MRIRYPTTTSGFSLIEAVVAGVIFSIAIAGVFASLSATQQPTADTTARLGAAYCGQEVLESFRAKVDQRDWASGTMLSAGWHTINDGSTPSISAFTACRNIPNITVTSIIYEVREDANGSRRVDLSVNW